MLPNKESYVVAEAIPYFEEVFDYLILYLQTQTNTPVVNSTFQNLIRNTCYSKIVNREPSMMFNHNIQKLLDIIENQDNESNENIRRLMIVSLHDSCNLGRLEKEQFLPLSFNVKDFLSENGINISELESSLTKETKTTQYYQSIQLLSTHFEGEIHKLNAYYTEFRSRLVNLLQQQSGFRPILSEESSARIASLQTSFQHVFQNLLESFRTALRHLISIHKHSQPKKRHFLSEKARSTLTQWFEQHLADPYPTEAEKKELADKCNITLLQVNYWFGNKRNRYKKKQANKKQK